MKARATAAILLAALGALAGCEEERAPARTKASTRPSASGAEPEETRSDRLGDLDRGMHVVLLGTGTPIVDPRRSGPSTAVVLDGRAYLVDAGPGVVRQADRAYRQGATALDVRELHHVLVTHLHSDHTVGLIDLARSPAVLGRPRPLNVWGPPGIEPMVHHLQQALSEDRRVRFSVEGERPGYAVHARTVNEGPVDVGPGLQVEAFEVTHGNFEHAFGYALSGGGRRVVVSGDTGPSEAVVEACRGCDVLVHEVYCASGLAQLEPSVQQYHRSFHTSSHQLSRLATRAKPSLLVLTHLLWFGCSETQLLAEVRSGYDGEVVLGEDLAIY